MESFETCEQVVGARRSLRLAALAQDDGGGAVRDRILIALIAVVIDAAGLFT